MEADLYYKIIHRDGKIENFHLNSVDGNTDFVLDLVSDLRKLGNKVCFITEKDFLIEGYSTAGIIDIHTDLHKLNDALGDYKGYMEHYEIK